MKRKKMKLNLGKLTIVNLDAQEKAKGGLGRFLTEGTCYCTAGTMCCTVDVYTCVPSPEACDPGAIPGQSTMCP